MRFRLVLLAMHRITGMGSIVRIVVQLGCVLSVLTRIIIYYVINALEIAFLQRIDLLVRDVLMQLPTVLNVMG